MPSALAEQAAGSHACQQETAAQVREAVYHLNDGLTILLMCFERLRQQPLSGAALVMVGQGEMGAAHILKVSEDLAALAAKSP